LRDYCGSPRQNAVKKIVFRFVQPAAIAALLLLWAIAPDRWVQNPASLILAASATAALVQALEGINERHGSWRLNRREFYTDCFYVILNSTVIAGLETKLVAEPLRVTKDALGITTEWAMHLPFLMQVALVLFLIEFGQYWMHRLMHNSVLWWVHAPHHHVTQLNALKGSVGNPVELFLISLSVIALFDLPQRAVFGAVHILTLVSCFAHANIRFDAPRWYSLFFTTVEHHSLHHSVGFNETRCNFANSLIVCDRICGTFLEGETEIVGQGDRKRLSIFEQFVFPLRPLIVTIKAMRGASVAANGCLSLGKERYMAAFLPGRGFQKGSK